MNSNEHTILQHYRRMVDATSIVSKTDRRGFITYVNNKFVDISGYTQSELIGKPHSIVRDPLMPRDIFRDMWVTLKNKKDWSGVVTNMRKDGSKYTVEAHIFPVLDSDNNVLEFISIRHDITKFLELSQRVHELHEKNIEQQEIAKEKLESGIVNDLDGDECMIFQSSAGALSGDFYSIHRLKDGSVFAYLLDGQGHSIAPALTVFAISSTINSHIKNLSTIDDLMNNLYASVRAFLGEAEQLSYTMLFMSRDKKSLTICSGGMYPTYIKDGNRVFKIKANNPPFMNFSPTPNIQHVELEDFKSLIIYTDGLIEHQNDYLSKFKPESLLKDETLIEEAVVEIKKHKLEDDVTFVYIKSM